MSFDNSHPSQNPHPQNSKKLKNSEIISQNSQKQNSQNSRNSQNSNSDFSEISQGQDLPHRTRNRHLSTSLSDFGTWPRLIAHVPLTGHYKFPNCDDHWALPKLLPALQYDIGEMHILADLNDYELPNLWISRLSHLETQILREARAFTNILVRHAKTTHNASQGIPFGRLTVQSPDKLGLAEAPDDIISALSSTIQSINAEYIKQTNMAVLKAIQQTFVSRSKSFTQLFQSAIAQVQEDIKEAISTMPPLLFDVRPLQSYLYKTNALFCLFDSEVERSFLKQRSDLLVKNTKKQALKETITSAKDDLMDVEMSSKVIESLIDERISAKMAQPKPAKSGNGPLGKGPATQPKPKGKQTAKKSGKSNKSTSSKAPPKKRPNQSKKTGSAASAKRQ